MAGQNQHKASPPLQVKQKQNCCLKVLRGSFVLSLLTIIVLKNEQRSLLMRHESQASLVILLSTGCYERKTNNNKAVLEKKLS